VTGLEAAQAEILSVAALSARLVAYDWRFPIDEAEAVARHWRTLSAAKPRMFNGQVLLQCRGEVCDGVFGADYFQTDFASFIAWHHCGRPMPAGQILRNGFAMAALKTSDGAYLAGRMGAHTVNAGQVYFAAGTPDSDDVLADGTVDLPGSLLRELEEETGLAPEEVTPAPDWRVVLTHGRAACIREVGIDLPAVEARSVILARLAAQAEPELDDIVIIRDARDIDERAMPLFMRHYLAHMLTR
jgi:8-oxo-dGTP pyrophosphatase MutT (NUDIX family)